MKPIVRVFLFVFLLYLAPYFPTIARAQGNDVTLPAGTLLHCTLDEPDLSSKTADVGDPVICNLAAVSLFGRPAFPRGAYLGGHLEADKDPGHFFGKGYLDLEFDHIGTPEGRLPLPAKVIGLRGYRVDRQGKIIGHGHATRDAVEWIFPPLWPVKVLTLPERGPRPTLKGEIQLTLRLMDDVAIPASQIAENRPRSSAAVHTYAAGPSHYVAAPRLPVRPPLIRPPQQPVQATPAKPFSTGAPPNSPTQNVLVLRSGATFAATDIRVEWNRLTYIQADGTVGAARLEDVDWTKTFESNSENGIALNLSGTNSSR